MTRLILVAIAIVAVIGIGTTVWINIGRVPAPGRDFFVVPQDYPTTGGQTLEPRWNASGERADAPAH